MSETLPFITVVIPAYNEAAYLPHCLTSLQGQTYPKDRYKVLVVDNNSTDTTAEVAEKFGAEVIKEKKQGHVFSLNAGLQHATGEIYAVTDSDTILAPNWLQTLSEIFADPTIVGVTGSTSFDTSSFSSWMIRKLYHMFLRANFALHKPHLAGPNMAMRASAFAKLHGVDTRYEISGDVEIGMRLKKYGRVIFAKNLIATTSSRRFTNNFGDLMKDAYKYFIAYIYAIWLVKPPRSSLIPVR